jgi:hypothetical protein
VALVSGCGMGNGAGGSRLFRQLREFGKMRLKKAFAGSSTF